MFNFSKYLIFQSSYLQTSAQFTYSNINLTQSIKYFSKENILNTSTVKKLDLKSLNLGSFQRQATLPFKLNKVYDAIVIGGGTGGLAFALEARSLGLEVALFDYVEPSLQGSTWGLGGTCVNVGCIPKKLFHISTLVRENIKISKDYGWSGVEEENVKNEWEILRQNVQNYIKGINFGYKNKLKELGIDFINAKASFQDPNTVTFSYSNQEHQLKAKNFVIATGVRPRSYPGIEELKKYAITSDDLFSLKENPGKTLVVGGGYIAIECAGFLRGLGNEVILMNRSTFMRVFDHDMADKVMDVLEEEGIKTIKQAKIKSVEKTGEREFVVELLVKRNQQEEEILKCRVNTILIAIGRDPSPESINANKIELELDKQSKKFVGRENELERTTKWDHIYAVGDTVNKVPELQTVAQKSGKLLAHRIFLRNQKDQQKLDMSEEDILKEYGTDYNFIPTTVFSPSEYSFVGLNEEEAIEIYGAADIEVFHREITPLYYGLYKNNQKIAYMKVIVSKSQKNKIVGIHYMGQGAEEMIGGFALAMKLGLTKKDLDASIGVHPSNSEDLFNLDVTKSSGKEFRKTEC